MKKFILHIAALFFFLLTQSSDIFAQADVLVSNAGTTGANGTYIFQSVFGGYNYYKKGTGSISYQIFYANISGEGSVWTIQYVDNGSGTNLYHSPNLNGVEPPVDGWYVKLGTAPEPSTLVLPVELISFNVRNENETIKLNWRTASEVNNSGFRVQRSANGKNWDDLAFVPGHGTTLEEQSYSYTDKRPLPGMNYYRLRQMDFDGTTDYSKVISVVMKNGNNGIRLLPNPATETVTLALETDYTGEATLTFYDLTGRLVKTQILSLEGGAFRTDIGLGGVPSGVYLAQVQAGREHWQQRLAIE